MSPIGKPMGTMNIVCIVIDAFRMPRYLLAMLLAALIATPTVTALGPLPLGDCKEDEPCCPLEQRIEVNLDLEDWSACWNSLAGPPVSVPVGP